MVLIPHLAYVGKLNSRPLSEYMVKSILAKDIDMMEKLGIYECSPEDFALCSFVCQSKTDVSGIIRAGLQLAEQDG